MVFGREGLDYFAGLHANFSGLGTKEAILLVLSVRKAGRIPYTTFHRNLEMRSIARHFHS
jgi:hypothetical protein